MMNEKGMNAWINETRGIMEIIVFVKYVQGGEKYIHIKVKRKSSNLPDSKFGIDLWITLPIIPANEWKLLWLWKVQKFDGRD